MAHVRVLKNCSLLWVCFQWNTWFHGILSSGIRVNRSSAQQQCENYGGIFSYQTFINENASDSLNKNYQQIHDGDSIWVSELVKYSQFVSWNGCYLKDAIKTTNPSPMLNKSVTSCFNSCNITKPLTYIGIYSDQFCYCISNNTFDQSLILPPSEAREFYNRKSLGDSFDGSMMLDICNKIDKLSKICVYKLYDFKQTPFFRSSEQCVYAKKITQEETEFSVEYGTRSCSSYETEIINDYICVDSGRHDLNTMVCKKDNSVEKTHCIMHELHAVDWYRAQTKCKNLNGRLVGLISKEIVNNMQTQVKYWTGLFRDFKIMTSPFDHEISEKDVCLSVRNISTKFLLEPAKCSDEKLKFCQNETISSELSNDNTIITFETDDNNKSSNVIKTFETNLTISLTFNGVFLLTIVCLAVCLAKVLNRRRRESAPSVNRLTCEKSTTTTRSNDTLADDSVFNAIASDEYHDDSHHYACPDNTATGTGRRENLSQDSGAKQYDHICLRNASNQNVGQSDNINVSDYSHIHVNTLAKVSASNQTMYEEIKVQTLDRKTETEL